jgi:hypothetical protein
MYAVLVIVLILLLVGALPVYPYSANFGPWPSGVIGLILIVVLIAWLIGAR